jgi:hypothetical protein
MKYIFRIITLPILVFIGLLYFGYFIVVYVVEGPEGIKL